jgi:hypothetical protein
VDEAAGDVEAEAEEPHYENDYKDSPEHWSAFRAPRASRSLKVRGRPLCCLKVQLVGGDSLSFCVSHGIQEGVSRIGYADLTV